MLMMAVLISHVLIPTSMVLKVERFILTCDLAGVRRVTCSVCILTAAAGCLSSYRLSVAPLFLSY